MKIYDVIKKENNVDSNVSQKKDIVSVEKKDTSWKRFFLFFLVSLFLTCVYLVGILFTRVTITINERKIPFSLDNQKIELIHKKNNLDSKPSFQVMIITDEVTKEVYGSELKPSVSNAKGQVIFINEYSKSNQIIKKDSFLIGENGKRYQVLGDVNVPGYTILGNLKKSGISKMVFVVAVSSGESFNSLGMNLSIENLSVLNSKLFYAKSVGAITGGEDGVSYMVPDTEKSEIINALVSQLSEKLKRESRNQIPNTLLSFPKLQFLNVDDNSLVLKGSSIKFSAKLKGSMVSYLISRNLLETEIANKVLSSHDYTNFSVPLIENIDIQSETLISTSVDSIPEYISINLSGDGAIITKSSPKNIKERLLGINKKDFSKILNSIPEIESAHFDIYPFWSHIFPFDRNNIDIVVK